MKYWGISVLIAASLLNICVIVDAQQIAPYFAGTNGSYTNTQYYGSNGMNANYYSQYTYQNSNSAVNLIFAKSLCNNPIESSLKGKSISINNNDSKFYLINGQVWKQYIMFGGQIIENVPSVYTYTSFADVKPTVKIYRDSSTNACRISINENDTGIYVYREI